MLGDASVSCRHWVHLAHHRSVSINAAVRALLGDFFQEDAWHAWTHFAAFIEGKDKLLTPFRKEEPMRGGSPLP